MVCWVAMAQMTIRQGSVSETLDFRFLSPGRTYGLLGGYGKDENVAIGGAWPAEAIVIPSAPAHAISQGDGDRGCS